MDSTPLPIACSVSVLLSLSLDVFFSLFFWLTVKQMMKCIFIVCNNIVIYAPAAQFVVHSV